MLFAVAGILLRLWFVLAASPNELTFHSGGSDAPAYRLLAQNILEHRGLSYAGQPTAFRPPGFPLLLAAFISVFHAKYISALRAVQFLIGLLTIGLCSCSSRKLFGAGAAEAAFVVGLLLPTMIFTTAQVLTECVAAFLTALFLLFLVNQYLKSDLGSAWGLGVTAGVESLIRFNAAALPLFAGWFVWRMNKRPFLWKRELVVLAVPLLIVAPWLVRNELVFGGTVLYSTQTGMNAVRGVLNSEGRELTDERLLNTTGWIDQNLETNDSSREVLGSEAELDKRALRLVPALWRQLSWGAVPLALSKVAHFWLGTDQLIDTKSFPLHERLLRTWGVIVYWVILGSAVLGWFLLHQRHREFANALLVYAAGLTILHLPLVMNTRLRIPLIEPVLIILSGAGWEWFSTWPARKAAATSVVLNAGKT